MRINDQHWCPEYDYIDPGGIPTSGQCRHFHRDTGIKNEWCVKSGWCMLLEKRCPQPYKEANHETDTE